MLYSKVNHLSVVVQLLSCVWLFVTPWNAARQASLFFTISWSLLKLMSIELVMLSSHLILGHFLLFLSSVFPASVSLPMSPVFAQCDQSIGASATVLPMNIQGWFSLELTDFISLQSKWLSRVFSNTTVQKHHSLALILLYGQTLTSVQNYWKNHSFDHTDLCWWSNVSAF